MDKNGTKITSLENSKYQKLTSSTRNRNKSIDSKFSKKFINKRLGYKDIYLTPKYDDILISKSKILQHINKIFFNISKYNINKKDYFITRTQLIDILKQSDIISRKIISENQAFLILLKIYPHKPIFNFSEFMNFLTELCRFLYKDEFVKNPKKTMDNFLSCLYNNYKSFVIEKNSNNFMEKFNNDSCTLKTIETIISSKLERPIFKLILTLYDSLIQIYKVYFPNEVVNYKSINEEKLMTDSFNYMFNFCKDFEIFPSIINKSNLNMYFNLLIKYQKEKNYINYAIISFGENENFIDLGVLFKFSTFVLSLYHLCIFYFYKKMKFQNFEDTDNNIIGYDEHLIDADKINIFFKKLENSPGIKTYLTKRGRTNENKYNFIFKKKDIKIAKNEMNTEKYESEKNKNKKNNIKNNFENKKSKLEKITINSSPYTSRQITEKNLEDEKNEINNNYTLTNTSLRNRNIFTNDNFNKYFEKPKSTNNYLISISDLDEILMVSPRIKSEIANKIEKLSEIFLQYSQISNKLEYNRMSFSSFIKFLEDVDILLVVPKKQKLKYRKISNSIISKISTISSIKKYENSLKLSISCNNITLSNEESDYIKSISKLVNNNSQNKTKNKNKSKITMTEASLIFHSITGAYNFPSHLSQIKKQFNKKDEFYDKHMYDYINMTDAFEPKKEVNATKDVPNKMNLIIFIKSFELIASKLYPNTPLDEAVSLFLDLKIDPFIYQINKISIKKEEINNMLEKLNRTEIKKILKKLGDIIYPFFVKFADNDKEMKFYQFFEFFIKFELFPEMLSLTQMKNIFYFLCEKYTNDLGINKDKNISDKINFDLFLKSLGITSMLFNFRNIISDTDRLLYIYYFILKSDYFKNVNSNNYIIKQISNNLKIKKGNKKFKKDKIFRRNSSSDNIKNMELKLIYDNKTKEYKCVSRVRTKYNFSDIYK